MPEKWILSDKHVPQDITLKDVIKWIEAEFGSVWDEYVSAFPDNWNIAFLDVITTDALCYCTFGSNEGIYLHIEDSRTRKVAIVGKTLDASPAKWYECCFSLARIGLEMREIY